MANRGMLVLGSILIGLGGLFLLGTIFQLNIWALCWPIFLIVAGVWVAFRPRVSGSGASDILFIGDSHRRGNWQVRDNETWVFVADVSLDFSQADIPVGETRLRYYGFVNNLKIWVPADVGLQVETSAFVNEVELFDHEYENIMTPINVQTEGYITAERKIRLEIVSFVAEVKVKHA